MKKIQVRIVNGSPRAENQASQDFLDSLKGNVVYSAKIYKERYHKHHAKYWAILGNIVKNSEYFDGMKDPVDNLHDEIKFGIGHVLPRKITIEGKQYTIRLPKSTDFASMDQVEFEDYYERAMDWLVLQDYLNTEGIV